MGKNLTLKDLAQKLGLSISTVSRALQNNPAINNDTRLRVHRLAKKIGYYPDALAKSLKNKKSYTIGVIVPEISHFFFSSVIDGIEEETSNDGYTILVTKSNEDMKREVLNSESLISNRVAGVIASISQDTMGGEHFNKIISRGIPLVLFDRVLDDLDVHKIVSDDFDKVYEMVNHLIDSGYQNIAYLAGPSHLNITMNRLDGYKKALIDNDIELIGNPNQRISIISFLYKGAHPHDLALLLDKRGVALRAGHHCAQPAMRHFKVDTTLRASVGVYNDFDEVTRNEFLLGVHSTIATQLRLDNMDMLDSRWKKVKERCMLGL